MPHGCSVSLWARVFSAAAVTCAPAAPSLAFAADAAPPHIVWRLTPSQHYAADIRMTHVIANDLGGVLKALAGSKADPVTILDERTIDVAAGPAGALDAAIVDVRRYGGDHPKDTSVVRRSSEYKGTLADDGKRTPSGEPLADAGDGALAELPPGPIAVGASWTFSRSILVDRELGQGTMTYTDTLARIDVRNGHAIAVIDVKGAGRVDVARDLAAKGFKTTDMTLQGTAEFDLTTALPGVQHYTAHAQWNTKVMWVHLGLIFDDTYDADPWTPKR